MSMVEPTLDDVQAAIRAHRFSYSDEDRLQEGLAAALSGSFPVEREVRIDARSRIDLVAGRIGVEVKVAGTVAELQRQISRYLASDLLDGLVVVTTRVGHLALPIAIHGKPVAVVTLAGQGL